MYVNQETGQQSIVRETGCPYFKAERGKETIFTTSGPEDPTGELKRSGYTKSIPGENIINTLNTSSEYVISCTGGEESRGEKGQDTIYTTEGIDDVVAELRRSTGYTTTTTGTPYTVNSYK